MSHEYHYNRTGKERKTLVKLIAEILGETAVYRKAPTFSYDIGFCHIDKNGTLSCPEEMNPDSLAYLTDVLKVYGFVPEIPLEDASETEINAENTMTDESGMNTKTVTEDADNAADAKEDDKEDASSVNVEPAKESPGLENFPEESQGLTDTITIEVPNEGFTEEALSNLQKIIASKEVLFKKSLGVSELPPIQVTEEKIGFPWFSVQNIPGEMDAYTRLVFAICNMARTQKRVLAKPADLKNEKFAMRIFLIRLGFIGDKYKSARKVLLRNLTGNSSWKSGYRPDTSKTIATTPEPDTVPADTREEEPENAGQDDQKNTLEPKEGGEPYMEPYGANHVPKP